MHGIEGSEYVIPETALERRLLLDRMAHELVHRNGRTWYWSIAHEVFVGRRGFAEDGSLPGFVTFRPTTKVSGDESWSIVLHVRFRAVWEQHTIDIEWQLIDDAASRRACEHLGQRGRVRTPPWLRFELRRAMGLSL